MGEAVAGPLNLTSLRLTEVENHCSATVAARWLVGLPRFSGHLIKPDNGLGGVDEHEPEAFQPRVQGRSGADGDRGRP